MDTLIDTAFGAGSDRTKIRRALVDYFYGFGITDAATLSALADRFMMEADAADDPRGAPQRAERAVNGWFADLLAPRLTRPHMAAQIGRAAFLIAGPDRWSSLFLAEGELPEGFVAALRRTAPVPAPEPIPVPMVAQELLAPSLIPFRRPEPQRISRQPA